jgi:hypothetical protein
MIDLNCLRLHGSNPLSFPKTRNFYKWINAVPDFFTGLWKNNILENKRTTPLIFHNMFSNYLHDRFELSSSTFQGTLIPKWIFHANCRRGDFCFPKTRNFYKWINAVPDFFTGLWKNNILENKRTTLTKASISHT